MALLLSVLHALNAQLFGLGSWALDLVPTILISVWYSKASPGGTSKIDGEACGEIPLAWMAELLTVGRGEGKELFLWI